MKRILIEIGIGIVAVVVIFLLIVALLNANKDKADLQQSNTTLFAQYTGAQALTTEYKTRDSLSAITSDRIVASYNDLKKYASYESERANDARVKLKYLQSLSVTGAQTTVVIDSSKMVYVMKDSARCFTYADRYAYLQGCLRNDSLVSGRFQVIDTIFTAVERIPHRFLFIKWGTKKIRQVITTNNPYTRLFYNEYLELK